MDIKKCDLCKKEINEGKYLSVRFDLCTYAEFCHICALPIFKFLQKNKVVDKDNKQIKKI